LYCLNGTEKIYCFTFVVSVVRTLLYLGVIFKIVRLPGPNIDSCCNQVVIALFFTFNGFNWILWYNFKLHVFKMLAILSL